ncbi:MAG: hypothetical protein ACM36C_05540 [Acidobacteriota bacterium]
MIQLLVVAVVVGLVVLVINGYAPIASALKTVISVMVLLVVWIWLMGVAGIVNMPTFGRP